MTDTTNRQRDTKISEFVGTTTIAGADLITTVQNGTNKKMAASDFIAGLGVTGTIVQEGAVTGTPVLDTQGTINNIRNIEDGPGILSSVSAENGLTIEHNISADIVGLPLFINPTAAQPTIASVSVIDGLSAVMSGNNLIIGGSTAGFTSQIIVRQASDLSGVLDSTKEYFLDGVIDMGAQTIAVPAGGLNLKGFDFDVSGLTSTEAAYTMFLGATAGDVLMSDLYIDVSGAGSQVFDLTDSDGTHAFEISGINFNNCTSLGEISGYRQGLEFNVGRFGGTPTLTFSGAWGGYRASTTIVRSLAAGMTTAIFAEGTTLTFSGRFLTDINVDLPASASFCDFQSSNFTNASTYALQGCSITRGGAIVSGDVNINPNILYSDIASFWKDNRGISNTHPGGTTTVSAEAATTISVINTFVDVAGTFTTSDLQHFDSPAAGQLRHLGETPREYRILGDLVVDGTANDDLTLKLVKWDNSASGFVDVTTQSRQVNSLSGGRNVAFFTPIWVVDLELNDYVKIQVANATSTANVTVENDSFYTVLER
jgi:hypothetical protein